MTITRAVARGSSPGPRLTITAGQHGRELNGIEACRRLIECLPGQRLRGTVHIFPVVNPPAVAAVSQTVPGEKQNPNRVWPGRSKGTVTERIAAAVAPFVAKSDYLIDLHAWSEWTVSTVLLAGTDDTAEMDLARAFGLPFIHANDGEFHEGNLKTFARSRGVVSIGVELTPQWRLREASVTAGVDGAINVLRHLGMIPGRARKPAAQWLYSGAHDRRAVKARSTGLYVRLIEPGRVVRKGQLLGRLFDLDGLRPRQDVRAPIGGVLINTGPCCHAEVESNIVQAGDMLAEVWKATRLS